MSSGSSGCSLKAMFGHTRPAGIRSVRPERRKLPLLYDGIGAGVSRRVTLLLLWTEPLTTGVPLIDVLVSTNPSSRRMKAAHVKES